MKYALSGLSISQVFVSQNAQPYFLQPYEICDKFWRHVPYDRNTEIYKILQVKVNAKLQASL